jgi:hypothetical protein
MNIPKFLFVKLFFSCAAAVSTFEVIGEREKKTERQMVGQTDSQMDRWIDEHMDRWTNG